MLDQVVRGPLLVVRGDGVVEWQADGALAADAAGALRFVGAWRELAPQLPPGVPVRESDGVMLPPLVDIHTHIPQHPIRGRFIEGIPLDAPGGRLLNGLKQNVFPAEARCNDAEHAEAVVRRFLADTLAHGIVGGVAYMTPSAAATEVALSILPATWSVGLVLMNQNCPADLCTDERELETDTERLAHRFGPRLVVTDRFAVAVDTPLRRRAAALAQRHGLRTQTHLNEQMPEKQYVEQVLYPHARDYTDVYHRDGLLDHRCIVAHCIHMSDDEWATLRDTGSCVAHCPTSNLLLSSGRMDVDRTKAMGIPYAIATDVGASPTVSMLAEMARFLHVHAGLSAAATPSETLYRATRSAAAIADLGEELGSLEVGRPMSFIEVAARPATAAMSADEAILALLPEDVDAPPRVVTRVTLKGRPVTSGSVAIA